MGPTRSANSTPVSPSFTVSSAPPRARAIVGHPHACASTGTRPKSSSPGMITAAARRYSSRISSARHPAQKRHPGSGLLLESLSLGAVSDDAERGADLLTCGDRQIDSLIGHERRHNEEMTLRCDVGGMKEDRVDGRIHDRCLAIIVSADPAGNVRRVGEEAMHASGRRGVPPRQPRQHRSIQPSALHASHACRTEIGVELIPRIPHR